MDSQPCKCSNKYLLKILLLVIILLQFTGLFFSSSYFGSLAKLIETNSQSTYDSVRALSVSREDSRPVDSVPTSSSNTEYKNSEYGFALAVPKVWNDIGFVTWKGVGAKGQTTFNYFLLANTKDNFMVSSIGIYPVATYVKDQCDDIESPCLPGVEIGRNNQYVFVSELISPEAFGDCYVAGTERFGGGFYEVNKELCEVGATGRYSERDADNFTVFEVK
ncbi:hypothetical protein A3I99_04200 [Candidatus Kaiserbacteria bacterium RIFCSPLOWO2_02_FULL_45_11b]|uniref:Uncharacterized protein n=1 Tax=Candidatus Kaiserbacteria bacterium RIFCSPLOWO2_12_FULL_45_26 TaxID=1798525 RepID=A0A1F6FHE3_9BACT|nr:MAG: hypothetical protein A2Z56_00935 [Candidatus Kaiserbacteria bacterium RIFCSPHIGHO2_12_45_16]OGG70110.1 MAG: hypothetical protein A2929_03415 [Candidatus Kaiserbacteria bacterium RIFCSPLOWO2_01_FULL_45_25]OGG83784.1 MAG: hypothetical protein A3I99_04200 [Candidatus Kaiserbacteria bacterium RIFCSPLOWO2_02_FULL_45_11b]OGG85280.1 MAG: hypothetical protein A3G90_04475 [Candidatus Kaiserbacteria bacterium RIFCSPLOWO2_12_FULL_45_26]